MSWRRWTVGERTVRGATDAKNRVFVALRYEGQVMHELSGPTALASLQAEAARLNRMKYEPPRPLPKTRTDGWRQSPHTHKVP